MRAVIRGLGQLLDPVLPLPSVVRTVEGGVALSWVRGPLRLQVACEAERRVFLTYHDRRGTTEWRGRGEREMLEMLVPLLQRLAQICRLQSAWTPHVAALLAEEDLQGVRECELEPCPYAVEARMIATELTGCGETVLEVLKVLLHTFDDYPEPKGAHLSMRMAYWRLADRIQRDVAMAMANALRDASARQSFPV